MRRRGRSRATPGRCRRRPSPLRRRRRAPHRIEQDDVPRRAADAVQNRFDDPRVLVRVATEQRAGRRLRQTDIRRMDVERVHSAVSALGDLRVARRRDLVDAVGAVHDPRARGAEQHQRARHQLGELGTRDADDLPRRAGGIRQRAEQIECGPHAKLTPHRSGVTHRRVERRREKESDAGLGKTPLHDGRRSRHADAQRFIDVRAARFARCGSIAVLRHPNAARGDHDRGARGNVEGAGSIAPGSARVEQVVVPLRHLHRMRPHRARESHDFRRTLAFHRQADQQAGDVRRRRAALHDLAHGGCRFVRGQILMPSELVDQRWEHRDPISTRQDGRKAGRQDVERPSPSCLSSLLPCCLSV